MSFKVLNVKGDGNCYYRCIWNIIKNDDELCEALNVDDRENEDEGAREIRGYVALSLKYEKDTKNILRNLLEIHKDVPGIENMYPLLKGLQDYDSFDEICAVVSERIESTSMMASGFEHDVIANRLCKITYDCATDLQLIVLTQDEGEDKDDLADKWLRQLYCMLPKIHCERVAILVNENNIHYKYGVFCRKTVLNKKAFEQFISNVFDAESSD